jgi:predicted peroxiredoxin
MLNALDMKEKGYDIKLVIEGSATKQVRELADPAKPFSDLYKKVKEAGVIDCVCKACSTSTGALKSAEEQKLPICGEMSGHPSMSRYKEAGYEVIVF